MGNPDGPSEFPQNQIRLPRVEAQLQAQHLGVIPVALPDKVPQGGVGVAAVNQADAVYPAAFPQGGVDCRLCLEDRAPVKIQLQNRLGHGSGLT